MKQEKIEPITINRKILEAEAVETTINIDHFGQTFSVYTSCAKASRMLLKRLPDYYKLAADKVSASCNDVPIQFLTKLTWGGLKGKQ